MIPLHDDIPTRQFPIVNYIIIALCSLVFMAQLQDSPNRPSLVEQFGMIPARVQNPDQPVELVVGQKQIRTPRGIQVEPVTRTIESQAVPAWLTLLTCVFLHGGWMHFLGNMWFLHIFGDNVEDRFGHVGYALFYLGCGIIASLVHYVSGPHSSVPTIGASGAIAGVMGAYFVWYPHAKVQTLIPIFFIIQIVVVPAPLFLGIWFLIQAFQGSVSIVAMQAGGVAWWAHIGGFVAGVIAAFAMGRSHLVYPRNDQRRDYSPHRVRIYRPRNLRN